MQKSMFRSAYLIALWLLFLRFIEVSEQARAPVEGTNAAAYYLLCDVYNVAANPPTSLYDAAEVEKIRSEIDVINASVAEETWFSDVSKSDEATKLTDAFKTQNGDYEILFRRWKNAVSKVADQHDDIKKLPTANPVVKFAQVKMKKIENQLERIIENMKTLNTSAKLDVIKESFESAIGEDKCTTAPQTCGIKGNRGPETCGKVDGTAGSGNGVAATASGTNLVVDFFCLCAKNGAGTLAGNGAKGSECVQIDGGAAPEVPDWQAGQSIGNHAINLWKAIKAGCRLTQAGAISSSTRGFHAINNVLAELGRIKKLPNSGAKQCGLGLLGVFESTDNNCNAHCAGELNTDNTGICVAYGKTPSEWETNMKWVRSMRTGLDLLAKAENMTVAIQNNFAHLKMLHSRAEEIYEEAKTATELEKYSTEYPAQNQSQNQSERYLTGKPTAHESSATNFARLLHFILLCTILI